MDDFKRVSVVDDVAVQAYITLRSAISEMREMYQKKAVETRARIAIGDGETLDAYRAGIVHAYEQVASDIWKLLNTKGGKEDDKV